MFSSRLPSTLEENAVTRALDRLRTVGTPIIDLTETNPTRVGIPYPLAALEDLAGADVLTYSPMALGMPGPRFAVSREFARQGSEIPPERIVLTASTSEAYSLLFKLLCDADDDVLIPQPSYPLFEFLSRLDNVRTVPYQLQQHAHWSLDRASIERALSFRTRAVLLVTPNNPTGSLVSHDDVEWLAELCAARGIAIIADEVFADYRWRTSDGVAARNLPADSAIASRHLPALCFSLGGLSKSAGLPQMKLGWMAVGGPDALIADAINRLELICDTYLSVSTPAQVAAAALIEGGAAVRAHITERVLANLAACREMSRRRSDVTMLEPEGGWCVVLQVPAIESEETIVLRLLEEQHVLVHPGYFFDFHKEAFLVLSLLPEPDVFAAGLARVLGS